MPRAELRLPLVAVEIGGERLDGAVVDAELAVQVAARGDEQHRPAAGAVQLVVGDRHRLPGHIGEHRQRIAELAGVDPGQQLRRAPRRPPCS